MRLCNMRKIAATRNYRLIKKAIDLSSTSPIPHQLKDWVFYGHNIFEEQSPTGTSIRNATFYKPDGTRVVIYQGNKIPGTNWELTYLSKEHDERGILQMTAEFCCDRGRPFVIWERGSRPISQSDTPDAMGQRWPQTKINELLSKFKLSNEDKAEVRRYIEAGLQTSEEEQNSNFIRNVEHRMEVDLNNFLNGIRGREHDFTLVNLSPIATIDEATIDELDRFQEDFVELGDEIEYLGD